MEINDIAPCGMNCALCHSYQDKKKPCPGCRGNAEDIRKSCRNCEIAKCEKLDKYCINCDSFPCKRLNNLDNLYRRKYKMSMLENLNAIKNIGEEKFIAESKVKYTCKNCGELVSVHSDNCLHCKAKI